jgi:Lon protease-like protein
LTEPLPLFPLGTVLFPGLVLPLHIFEERYRSMIRDLVTDREPGEFGVVAIRRGWEVERVLPGGPPTEPGSGPAVETAGLLDAASGSQQADAPSLTLYEVGCTAEIRQLTERPDDRYDLVTVGRRRFKITSVDRESKPYLQAEVEWMPESTGEYGRADALAPGVLALFQRYLRLMRVDSEQVGEQLPDDPTVLSYLVGATAALTLDDRQSLLAAAETTDRLRAERKLLSREVALLAQVRAVPVPLADLAVPSSPN